MPLILGPFQQVGPDEEDQEAPDRSQVRDTSTIWRQLRELAPPPQNQPAPRPGSTDEFTRSTVDASRSLAQELTGQQAGPVDRFLGVDPSQGTGFLENARNSIVRGFQMVRAGFGEALGDVATRHASLLQSNRRYLPEEFQANLSEEQADLEAFKQRGDALRREAIDAYNELAEQRPANFIQWASGTTLEMLPMVVAAGAGALATGGLGGAFLGAGAISYPIEKTFLKEELEQEGLSERDAETWSSAAAVPIALAESAFEAFAAGGVAEKLLGKGTKRVFAQRIAQIAKETGKGAAFEGSTEALQEAIGMGTVAIATGNRPGFEEIATRLGQAAAAGAVGGASFGGIAGFAGEVADAAAGSINTELSAEELLRDFNFDPDAVEVGKEVLVGGERRRKVQVGEQTRWRRVNEDGTLGPFAKTPEPEQVRREAEQRVREEINKQKVATATKDIEPTDVPVGVAAQKLSEFSGDRNIDPPTAELNVRRLAINYLGTVRRERLTPEEAQTEVAALEAMALDPSREIDYPTRLSLLARKRALEYQQRVKQRESGAAEALDVTALAKRYAEMDGEQFDQLYQRAQASGNPAELRPFQEALRLRRTEGLVTQASETARDLISEARNKRRRGMTIDTQVVSEGSPGRVVVERPSGFVEVLFEGEDTPRTVDPANLEIIPQPEARVETTGGQVAEVVEVNDAGMVRLRLQDGSEAIIEISEIEFIDDSAATKPEMEKKIEVQELSKIEDKQPLPAPMQVVDRRTGQPREITEVGRTSVKTVEGDELPKTQVSTSTPDDATLSTIKETGEIPVFQAGTQPSAPGRHINFLEVPKRLVDIFKKQLVNSSLPASVLIQDIVKSGGRLTVIPQRPDSRTVTFAIELPAENRSLTDAGKKILGFLGGKNVKLHPNTLRAKVNLTGGNISPEDVRVMEIPPSLAKLVDHTLWIQDLDYARRLTDFGFEAILPEQATEAMDEAAELSALAADNRISGDLGVAEKAEIEAAVKRYEAAQATLRDYDVTRQMIWDQIEYELYEQMDPEEVSLIEALNEASLEEIVDAIPGISDALAANIVQHRREEGSFFEIEELEQVQGVGPARAEQIYSALSQGALTSARNRVRLRREGNLRKLLDQLPARSQNETGRQLGFHHPDIPGLTLIIDKERRTVPDRATRDVVEKDVYHIEFHMPDGSVTRSRTIGSDREESILIPASFARNAEGGSPPAVAELNEGLRNNEPFMDIVENMRDRREKVRMVQTFEGEKLAVLEESEGMLVVADESGQTFQLPQEQIKAEAGREVEPLVPFPISRQLTKEEILSEVIAETRDFSGEAGFASIGEWATNTPNYYGDVREQSDGSWRAEINKKPDGPAVRRPILYKPIAGRNFETRAEAEAWMRGEGFWRTDPARGRGVVEAFENLDPWDEVSLVEGERTLTDILDFYSTRGYIPQPVRDYAVKFAARWTDDAPPALFNKTGGLYGSWKLRKLVGIYTARDAQIAQQRGDPEAIVTGAPADYEVTAGNVVVDRPNAGQVASDVRVLDGILMDRSTRSISQEKQAHVKKLFEQSEHRERFLDLADVDSLPAVEQTSRRLVRVGGRLGIIIDSQPGRNTLTVQTFIEGRPVLSTVPKKDAVRVRNPKKALDFYRAARDGLGELRNLPRTPEMGSSPIDSKLGLVGVDDEVSYIEGLNDRLEMIQRKLKVNKGNITGDIELVNALRDAWIRMAELGIKNSDLAEGQIPEDFVPILQSEAYEEIANTFSNISPYGDLIAKAKLDLLDRRKRNQIDEQASFYGIDPSLPTYQKVEELISNVWDPHTADMLYQMRRDVGMLRFSGDAHVPEHGLEMRMPAMGSNIRIYGSSVYTMTPREAANRHPTIRLAHHLWEKARTKHGNRVKRGVDIIKGLQGWRSGVDLEKKQFIWDLLESPELGAAMDRPSDILTRAEIDSIMGEKLPSDWDWYTHYYQLRNLMVEARREGIRNALVRGFSLNEVEVGDIDLPNLLKREQELKKDYNLTPQEARRVVELAIQGEPAYMLDRTSNPAYARPRDEVEAFLDLQEEYHSFSEIPESVVERMRDSKNGWMVQEFDFWARYGHNNYAPLMLQGRHKILMKTDPDQEDRLVAFAPDGTTALEFAQKVAADKVPGIPANAELYFEMGPAIADDIDMEFLGPARFKRFYAEMSQKYGGIDGAGAKIARQAVKALNLGRERAVPKNLHTEARTSDLSQVIEDPYERLLMYWARTSRNNFLLDVADAYETALSLDHDVSRAAGIDALQSRSRNATHARRYLKDLRDSFMGVPSDFEKSINNMFAMVHSFAKLAGKPKKWAQLAKNLKDPDYDFWSDPTMLEDLYNEDFAARRFAEEATTVQSVIRLGLNLGGAAINSTQHVMHTAAWLTSQGVPPAKALKFSLQGMKEAGGYMKNSLFDRDSSKYADLQDFVREAGTLTVPARGIAGPGLGITGQQAPLYFEGETFGEMTTEFLEWASMWPFARAEDSVRLSASFAGRLAALDQGLEGEAVVNYARDVVDNTQFQYYDQALPKFMRGAIPRVLFQFQQFPLNAMKYEKDMLMGFLPKSLRTGRARTLKGSDLRKGFLMYNAIGATLGGATWMAARPAVAILASPFAKAFGVDSLESLLVNLFGGAEDREDEQRGNELLDPELLSARNAALYGIPGLAGFNISARLGVAGLELDPTRARDMVLGPTGSMYADLAVLLAGDERHEGLIANQPDQALLLGLTAGALRTRLGPRWGAAPLATYFATPMADLATYATGHNFNSYIRDTEVGREFMRSMHPRLTRGLLHTIDIFDNEMTYDASMQQRIYPGALNKSFEMAAAITGLQPLRTSEERALLQWRIKNQMSYAKKTRTYLEQAAIAANEEGINSERVMQIIADADAADAPIDPDQIQRFIDDLGRTPLDRIDMLGPSWLARDGRNSPGGRD